MSKEVNSKEEEEIELGSLFAAIGRGFSSLFKSIGTFFKAIFHFIILILLFVKSHFIKIAIAALIGVGLGSFLEFRKEKTFGADLHVQPNFSSTRQLYNTINYYNDLVQQKDTLQLEKTFQISKATAASLKKFEIFPIENENDLIISYNNLVLSVDTLTTKNYSFELFTESFTEYNYKEHTLTVIASKKDVFSKLDAIIISSVVDNKYFSKVKALANENLDRTDALLRQNLVQMDTLRKVYMKVMIEESKKQFTGTNIDLGGAKTATKELELFETSRGINEELKKISKDKSYRSEVINVISNFQPTGYEIKGITKNYGFLLGVLGGILMVCFLLLAKLNKYLNSYRS
jgi:hypothetical protein